MTFPVRQSTLEDARCLYRYKRHHIDGIAQPESEYASRGTALHKMHELYVDHLVDTKSPTDWARADEIADQFRKEAEASSLFKDWARRRMIDWEHVYATEHRIALNDDFKHAPEGRYRGAFDRLEIDGTSARICDLKSHFRVFAPTTIQAIYYPWLLHKEMPQLTEIHFELDFVRYDIIRSRTFTADEIDALHPQIMAQVARLTEAYERDEWPATPNAKCSYCVVECPLVEEGLSATALRRCGSQADAVRMARELHALQTRARQLQGALGGWAGETGPVRIENNLELGFEKRRYVTFPAEQIMRLNGEFGFARTRALHSDSRELRKIEREYPEYMEKLKKWGKDRGSTTLDFRSVDPADEDGDDAVED